MFAFALVILAALSALLMVALPAWKKEDGISAGYFAALHFVVFSFTALDLRDPKTASPLIAVLALMGLGVAMVAVVASLGTKRSLSLTLAAATVGSIDFVDFMHLAKQSAQSTPLLAPEYFGTIDYSRTISYGYGLFVLLAITCLFSLMTRGQWGNDEDDTRLEAYQPPFVPDEPTQKRGVTTPLLQPDRIGHGPRSTTRAPLQDRAEWTAIPPFNGRQETHSTLPKTAPATPVAPPASGDVPDEPPTEDQMRRYVYEILWNPDGSPRHDSSIEEVTRAAEYCDLLEKLDASRRQPPMTVTQARQLLPV